MLMKLEVEYFHMDRPGREEPCKEEMLGRFGEYFDNNLPYQI